MPEELKFEIDYKGEKHGFHYNLESAAEQDVAHACAEVFRVTDRLGFAFSGINPAPVDKFVDSLPGSSAPSALKSLSASALRSALSESAGEKEKLTPASEAYFFSRLLQKFSLDALARPEMFPGKVKAEKTHPEGRVALLAKYKSWVAIKKMAIAPGVQGYEVSGTICAINETLVKKAFDFAQIDLPALDSEAKKLAGGKRKSYPAIGEAMESLPDRGKSRLENAYLLHALLREFGVRPYAHREMLSKQYPDIKVPKPRGRMPKA
jgi:hypothetical protein